MYIAIKSVTIQRLIVNYSNYDKLSSDTCRILKKNSIIYDAYLALLLSCSNRAIGMTRR